MAAEKQSSKGQAWFCTTGLPSDVVIEVDNMAFHLHKFPLMSKSRKLHDLITEQENKNQTTTKEDDLQVQITLPNFPGGSESFETAAKFCYGVKIELLPTNAAPLRCAAEYLTMTEEYSEENLISKTEVFLRHSVFKNISHSVKALASCQKLMPLAENLGIVERCIEAIAEKSVTADPSMFGWPIENSRGGRNRGGENRGVSDSWLDELGHLSLAFLQRLIFAMRALNVSGETIESCLMHYANKNIPGISRATRKPLSSTSSQNEQRELLETIISNLPTDTTSPASSSNATPMLFGLLRTAYILNASEGCRLTLEKRIGLRLEEASLDDLLIPSYSYLNETLYDVECVERILGFFLNLNGVEGEEGGRNGVRDSGLVQVGKLVDGYLSEIASDANLKPEKFYDLAVALPEKARVFDDGLYRALDVYLKAHPWISEVDREKICGLLDCQKLTLEACTHAAQNERLPLRAVVQVLFFEQLQLRHVIAGTVVEAGRLSNGREEEDEVATQPNEGIIMQQATTHENQVLRLDMDGMRTRVQELERECSSMRKAIEKIDKMGTLEHAEKGGWRTKFGCKFKTQVCDSQQPATVAARKGRRHRHRHEN